MTQSHRGVRGFQVNGSPGSRILSTRTGNSIRTPTPSIHSWHSLQFFNVLVMHTCMFNKGFWRCVYKLAYIIHTAYIGDQLALAKETLHQRLLPKCSTGLSEVIRTLLWVCCTHLQELGVCAVQVAWVGQVQEGPAHHQVAHHCGYVCMCRGQMGTTSTLVLLMSWHECANCASVQRQASVQLFEAAVHGAVTCFHTCLQK